MPRGCCQLCSLRPQRQPLLEGPQPGVPSRKYPLHRHQSNRHQSSKVQKCCSSPRPPRQSFLEGPSTVFWVAVVACTVVIRPSLMPAGQGGGSGAAVVAWRRCRGRRRGQETVVGPFLIALRKGRTRQRLAVQPLDPVSRHPPKASSMTLARGARQLVVHEALDTTSMDLASYFSWFTPCMR